MPDGIDQIAFLPDFLASARPFRRLAARSFVPTQGLFLKCAFAIEDHGVTGFNGLGVRSECRGVVAIDPVAGGDEFMLERSYHRPTSRMKTGSVVCYVDVHQ